MSRVRLRPLEPGDVPALLAYRRDPAVARWQGWDTSYSAADAERLLAASDLIAPGRWVQRAVVAADDRLLGDVGVHALAAVPRTAEIGITIAPEAQGRGVAAAALRVLLGALFGEHGLHRVIAHVDDRNAPAQRLFASAGFRCEARHVDADWFKGEWATLRTYALLAREWPPASTGA